MNKSKEYFLFDLCNNNYHFDFIKNKLVFLNAIDEYNEFCKNKKSYGTVESRTRDANYCVCIKKISHRIDKLFIAGNKVYCNITPLIDLNYGEILVELSKIKAIKPYLVMCVADGSISINTINFCNINTNKM